MDQAQPQEPVSKAEIITDRGTFPAGTPLSVIRAAAGLPPGPSIGATPGQQAGPSRPVPDLTSREGFRQLSEQVVAAPRTTGPIRRTDSQRMKDIATGGVGLVGDAVTFGGNVLRVAPPVGVALAGLGGAIKAGSEGESMGEEALTRMALQLGFGGLGKGATGNLKKAANTVLPRGLSLDPNSSIGLTGHAIEGGIPEASNYALQRTSLGLGGVKGETREVANAVIRRRQPIAGTSMTTAGGVSLGNPPKVQRAISNAGERLEKAETNSTARVQPSDFSGSTIGTSRSLESGMKGPENVAKVKTAEEEFIREQTLRQMAKEPVPGVAPLDPATFSPEHARNYADILKKPNLVKALDLDANASNPRFSLGMRDLGNIRRRTGMEAEPTIIARKAKEQINPSDSLMGSTNEAFHSKAKLMQDRMNPEVVPINRELSDLFSIKGATEQMRGVAPIGTPGEMGALGGLGHGVASNVARVFPNSEAIAKGVPLAGPLMIALGRSGTLSKMGGVSENALQAIPALLSSGEITFEDIPKILDAIRASAPENKMASSTSGVSFRKP